MPTKSKRKKYKGFMINGSSRLNSNLTYLRSRTGKTNRILLEEVFCPLSQIIASKYEGNYNVIVEDNQIVIKVYSREPTYFNGSKVPMNQVYSSITKGKDD
jgi:hypothetical protein